MMKYSFIVEGEPFPKQRPRAKMTGRFPTIYTPHETKKQEKKVRDFFYAQRGMSFDDLPIKVSCDFYFKIGKSFSKKQQMKMASGQVKPTRVVKDIDNCLKLVMDALNGVAWHDDKQVVEIQARKFYGFEPRTVVTIEEVK